VNSVEVASVTAREHDPQPIDTERTSDPALADFSAALVFVIDATASMGPYIEAAREVVARVSERIKEAGLSDRMRFGLVGYRDDPQAVAGMEYLTRVFVDPNTVKDGAAFLRQAAALKASNISTRTYVEDGFAGLMTAIDGIEWSGFGGRYIVLITDASSRDAGDPFGSTGLNAEQVREKALENSIAIYTVHLKTPAGADDHSRAERQYNLLSDYPNVGSLYYPIDAGSVDRFRTSIDALADAIVTQVEAASRGEFAAGSSVKPTAKTDAPAAEAKAEADLRQKTALLGYAMQLSYIGRVQGVQAPPLLRAWTVDRDLDNPANQALQVRVLLTKNQLSDLQAALKEIVDVGIATEISRQQFFDQLKSAAATLSRDPARVGRQGATNLKELGLLGEYLDDLPYRSRVLALSEEMWNRWTIGEQVAFVDDLEAKIRLYQSFHDDVDTWVNLDDGASPGDAVYPVPLSALP
jgi:serine/threonine-protein kinase PpkA